MLRRADTLEAFHADLVGSWFATAISLNWVASPSSVGSIVWGAPDVEQTREIMRVFEGLWSPQLADRVDVILDATRVERIDPTALAWVVQWSADHREDVVRVVRRQIGVVQAGIVGITLSGILPTIGETHPFRVVHDPLEAHRDVDPEHGESLHRELSALVDALVSVSSELRALRALLRDRHDAITVAEAARALGLSTRTLQRALGAQRTSFQNELREARWTRARALLLDTDDKIVAIAHRIGVTEGALTELVRERTGCTPTELRRRGR